MSEFLEWRADGTPVSPRFGDVYRTESGGLQQARQVFMQGCGLPERWQGQCRFVVLETGFGLGLNFLATWQAWQQDSARPTLLHYVAIEAWPVSALDVLHSAQAYPELAPLAQALQAQWWGLQPGFHRLVFEQGRVILTLCIGDVQAMLRELQLQADAVYLDGFSPRKNPAMWSLDTLKGVARCCQRTTTLATWSVARALRDDLTRLGFEVQKVPGLPPKRDRLQAQYNPAWEPRRRPPLVLPWPAQRARQCVVIGAGLAGAASAALLAQRGWQVTVLEAAQQPATGASGLPAGLFAPHFSSDDGRISRLTRRGLRLTLQTLQQYLPQGQDWALSGVLEHRLHGRAGPKEGAQGMAEGSTLDADPPSQDFAWSESASDGRKASAHLSPTAPATWHRYAGWLRPAALVHALLHTLPPRAVRYGAHVHSMEALPDGRWQLKDASGQGLISTDLVVVAAGFGSVPLVETPMPLQTLRGQLSTALHTSHDVLPATSVNGHGSFIAHVPTAQGLAWYSGSTFEVLSHAPCVGQPLACRERDDVENLENLAQLLPTTAASLRSGAAPLSSWTGVRCASADRLPLVGPLSQQAPGVWLCTALGTRGLTWGLLCAELSVAHLEGEPLPLEQSLARALLASRSAPKTHV